MRKVFLFFSAMLFASLFFTSCQDEPTVDPRDEFIGSWSMTAVGSATMYYNGESMGTIPFDETEDNVVISKVGSNDLDIDGMIFTLSNGKLTAPTKSETQNDPQTGLSLILTETLDGTATSEIITITSNITGSWSGQGMSGTIAGKATYTFNKR